MKSPTIAHFRRTIWNYYRDHKRAMPWRDNTSAYWVFVSEVMLQQTQVNRVADLFPHFIKKFPTFAKLAAATNAQILTAWKGMGYNRRALMLRNAAKIITTQYEGQLPQDPLTLDTLPGIGYATACSIAAFAFNAPVVFIETNIRRVFIHYFFTSSYPKGLRGGYPSEANKSNGNEGGLQKVHDNEIFPLVEKSLDKKSPREWYYALMDYGTHLAATEPNSNLRSKHYKKQAPFEGSVRQLRGELLRLLLSGPRTQSILRKKFKNDNRFVSALAGLLRDGIIQEKDGLYFVQ